MSAVDGSGLGLALTSRTVAASGAIGSQGSLDPGVLPLNVKDFGAKGDGVTDDAPAIRLALAAIPITGGAVFFPAGIYMIGSTVSIPVDRQVLLQGVGDQWNNNGSEGGSILKRVATFITGALLSQVTPGVAHSAFGVLMRDLCLDGNNVAGDLLVLTQMQGFRLSRCTFANGNGNGCLITSCFNFFLDFCRWFELGNTTAFPNGASALAFFSNATGGSVEGWITQPHFESGRGSYITSHDATGTNPIVGLTFLGGKMEWSGNQANPAPAAGSGLGIPFVILEGNTFVVLGMLSVNGFNTAATHWRLQNIARSLIDVICTTSDVTDANNPRFFVDLFSSLDGVALRGVFRNGASVGGGAGAQIRVVESTVTGYTILPSSVFDNPLNGVAIAYTNPTTGRAAKLKSSAGVDVKAFAVNPAIAAQVIDAGDGDHQEFVVAANIAVVVQAPTRPPATGQSQRLSVTFFNTSGGALATAPTFAAGAGAFLLAAAVVNPGNGTGVTYTFEWSPNAVGGARYREVSRTVAF